MSRLFAGTPWDRPPTCERCGKLEVECHCPPPEIKVERTPPSAQTARLVVEKRPKGKVVTVVAGLSEPPDELERLAALLKGRCGAGGTLKEGCIELQGNHLQAAETALQSLGYQTKRK